MQVCEIFLRSLKKINIFIEKGSGCNHHDSPDCHWNKNWQAGHDYCGKSFTFALNLNKNE